MVFLIVGALAIVGTGCGDDDAPITTVSSDAEATGTEATPDTPDEFIAAADARCAEANAAIANLSTGTEVSAVAAGQELEITQDLLDGLQSLSPPDDPALDSYFAALEDQIAVLGEQESAASGGDAAAAAALETDLDAARSQALSAADEFGFEECGQQGTALTDDGGETTTVVPGETPAAPTTTTPAAPTTTTPAPAEPAPEPVEPVPGGGSAPTPAPAPPPDDSGGGGSSGGVSPG